MMSTMPQYDAMVICSTQNQMVNYLAILHHAKSLKSLEIVNLTLKHQENKRWDTYLKNVLEKELGIKPRCSIILDENQLADHNQIWLESVDGIQNVYKDKRLLWNITGGQRHIVMAITEFVNACRPDDCIVYFEGRQSRFYYYYPRNKEMPEGVLTQAKVQVDAKKLNLDIAFALMGFEVGKTSKKREEYCFLNATNEETFNEECPHSCKKWQNYKDEMEFYVKLYDKYTQDKAYNLLHLLRKASDTNGEISKILETETVFSQQYGMRTGVEILRDNVGKRYLLGSVLEQMVFYQILHILGKNKLVEKVADVLLNIRSTKTKTESDEKLGVIDEFDIAILTSSGKVIIFECKSGRNTTGDHMKSHHYSTYAVSGVYGTPILLTPLISKARTRMDTNSQMFKLIDEYESITKYALKANVVVWYLKDLEENLEELLKGGPKDV